MTNGRSASRQTNYLSRRQVRPHVRRYFEHCRFAEDAYFDPPRVPKYLTRFPRILRMYYAWLSATQMRVLMFGRKRSAVGTQS